jgi:DNA invertase Pin-like site-specific DNA recombinase
MLVGYLRVSSADERQSVDLQRDALLTAGVDERHFHVDKASGARDDRPGLKACLAYLEAGDVLVVWKLDRLGRSLPHLLAIVADLKARGVAFRSLTERMDTTTPHGELLFAIFGALAQYERALTRERVMAGLAAARRRGRTGGRPPALDAERIEQITKALDGGASKASVCRAFQVPRSTLLDTLARVGWTGPMAPPGGKAPAPSAKTAAAQRRRQADGR